MTLVDPGTVVVSMDLFPASVALWSGLTYEASRAVIADDVLQVWKLTVGGPQIMFQRPVVGASGSARDAFTVHTPDGVVVVGKSGGCSCGSQLAYADLWPGLRRVNVPLNS